MRGHHDAPEGGHHGHGGFAHGQQGHHGPHGHHGVRVALVGTPNCGKTSLFNRLTGSRQKVANYAGVTVERKEGRFTAPSGRHFRVLDLPGAYSLEAASPDEVITRDVCLGQRAGETPPDLIVGVLDATNLRLHLRFALELRALGRPLVFALNMMDDAARRGIIIDRAALERELGVPIVETVAIKQNGAHALIEYIDSTPVTTPAQATPVADVHAEVRRLIAAAVTMPRAVSAVDERLDRIILHRVWGLAILAALLFLMFQAVYAGAAPLMEAIDSGVAALGHWVGTNMAEGPLKGLLVDGVIAGAGSVLVFLPQILILFFFILVLEQSGYLPRAAFLLDRLMVGAGLSGRSFIPLLSSFACAIPGIMATRTIQHPSDRFITILVAPLMTCSARLPVYALLIGAFVPSHTVAGVFNLQGVVLFGLYAAGIVSAVLVALVAKWLRRNVSEHPLMLELPAYRMPHARDIGLGLLERGHIFVRRVGTIILALTVVLWGLSSWPGAPEGATQPGIYYSLAGQIGRALEVIFAPIGFNWQICIALVPGLAAREVAVGALGTVYALSATGDDTATQLMPLIAHQWSIATGFALLAWYIFAPQCIATLAVIRRETGSVKTAALAAGYLTALAYVAAFATYRITLALT